MTYEEIIPVLNNNHIYPKKRVRVKKKSEVIEGLEVWCSPILKESKEAHLKKVLGEDWRVEWFPNEEYFLITVKEK